MKKRLAVGGVIAVLVVTLFTLAALATTAEMYFSTDKNGANRVTNVQEGDEIWIAVYDPDENIDCDVRDKMSPDIKIMDPKTGAYIIWNFCTTTADKDLPGSTLDYLEETGADTGLFVSNRSFQVGTRESYADSTKYKFTHVVDTVTLDDFTWGHYLYGPNNVNFAVNNVNGDARGWFGGNPFGFNDMNGAIPTNFAVGNAKMPSKIVGTSWETSNWLVGRFENMDTLVGMYQDPSRNEGGDVAITMAKITDTKATISWDQEVYKDANGTATITVVDPDENLNCNEVEYVPVFIIVNPGSWNMVQSNSAAATLGPANFCDLKGTGGVDGATCQFGGVSPTSDKPIRWYNIYNSEKNFAPAATGVGAKDGRYYIKYDPALFSTTSSCSTPVSFYAQETGVSTGVFQLNLNSILDDLGFDALNVRDVMVAYYLDPNDFDDFTLATSYIEEHQHSVTSFTDAMRGEKSVYWIGRDPVYVQVIDSNANVDSCCPEQVVIHVCDPHGEDDSEWLIADETSSNSPVFFTNAGTQLLPVWDPLGVGLANSNGGYQLQLDNWKLEAFNEDSVYVRYNDVYYVEGLIGMAGLGDVRAVSTTTTAFPPKIRDQRVANDVSFDLMSVADTQVYDGTTANMYFLDRQGNRVSGYVNSDCVFIEVVDPDQNEDQYRRERVDGYWDKMNDTLDQGQNLPFGPLSTAYFACTIKGVQTHPFNALLGTVNIADTTLATDDHTQAKLYVLNPRNGHWAAVDLLETGSATGDFVSVTCIELVSQYECLPTLGVKPGDTIVAFYQDPSNHSDSAMISIKIGIGGGGTPPGQASTTMFVDSEGGEVTSYTDADDVYVKVIDPSKAGAASILDAVTISGTTYDLAPLADAATDTFITEAISGLGVGTFTATYADPTDPTDTSSDTITIIASELSVDNFYAGPNPFETEVTFGYNGSGIAATFSVTVYNLSGHQVWTEELANVDHVTWDGSSTAGSGLANGGYIYVVMATDGENTFTGKGTVFINK